MQPTSVRQLHPKVQWTVVPVEVAAAAAILALTLGAGTGYVGGYYDSSAKVDVIRARAELARSDRAAFAAEATKVSDDLARAEDDMAGLVEQCGLIEYRLENPNDPVVQHPDERPAWRAEAARKVQQPKPWER